MTSDQEPRYRLVDDNGVIRGTLYGKPDGSIAIQETDSGADREVALAPDGTFSAPSVETESVNTGEFSNGVAGEGNTITAVFGNAAEYRRVASIPYLPGNTASTDSDTYVELGTGDDRVTANIANIGIATNIESTLYVSVSGEINGAGSLREADSPSSEVTTDTGTPLNGPIAEYGGSGNAVRLEGKSSTQGGNRTFSRMVVHFYERIES